MDTLKLDVTAAEHSEAIKTAAEILKSGGIVAIPTETVYGLAASAMNDSAIEKVFAAKGRPQDNPLIVHIARLDSLKTIARDIPDVAYRLAEEFWPGPLTMVLKKTAAVCASVSAGLDTVAVRMPSHPVAREVILESGLPLAAPSANISGAPSPTTAAHVVHDLDGKADAILLGGDCDVGVESTVVALFGNTPRLLRPGAVTPEQLKRIIPGLVIDPAVLKQPAADCRVASPGMKYKHYSPKTPVFLVEGSRDAFADLVNSKRGITAVCFDTDSERLSVPHICYGSKSDPASLAHNLFEVLRSLDERKTDAAYVHAPDKSGVGLAVYNRLIRAAAFRVIQL